MKTKPILVLLAVCAFATAALAGIEQTVSDLIPRLAATKIEDRYAPQMELQALAANAARPGAEAERAALAKVLAAKAADPAVPQPAKVWIVRQLEYIGAAESVSALRALLRDPDAELRECARRALEKNPARAATASLRAALKQGGDTSWKIGLIQSLGERGDAKLVSLIAQNLGVAETSFAAASALAKIASKPAMKELWLALDKKNPVAADALLAAANRLLAQGQINRAAVNYLGLFSAADSVQLRAAALTGLAKTDPATCRKLITPTLALDDLKLQNAALTAAREIYGKDASTELASLLPNLKPMAKVSVLRFLDASAEKQVLALATDANHVVGVAALETLGRIGGATSVPLLVKTAAEPSSDAQKAAKAALARISGPGADAAIAKLAAEGDANSRAAAISAFAGRNDQASLPALLIYAAESDRSVSTAACDALGRMGADSEIEPLARLALSGSAPGAEAALQAVAARCRDKSGAVARLAALGRTAPAQQLPTLFDTLVVLGGNEALNAVTESAAANNDEVKDAAIRALANWPDFAATKPLLVIVAAPTTTRIHNVLAIQAVVRLVKASDKEPAGARLDAALAALNAAAREEDKKLVLSALASVPSAKAADALQPFLNEAAFKAEAGLAGMTLAEGLLDSDRPAAKHLAQAVKDADISPDLSRKAEEFLKK